VNLSPIEWTDYTANPIRYKDPDGNIVHACIHKSGGCLHCYAETLARRWGRKGMPFTAENMKRLTPFLDEEECHRMRTHKPAAGKRCFIGDMTDIFGEWMPIGLLNQLFSNTLEMRDNVTWQILTKRADQMQKYLSWRWGEGRIPMRNIWLGVSVEDQKTAIRLYDLAMTPAAVRFCSYEPALSRVNFRHIEVKPGLFWDAMTGTHNAYADSEHIPLPPKTPGLDQLIVGGESGPGARPFDIEWAEYAKDQCSILTKFFMKQMGSFAITRNDRVADVWYYADGSDMDTEGLDGDSYRFQGEPVRLKLKDRKGGDPSEWPEDLRVREFPR
jgi:protein gp37